LVLAVLVAVLARLLARLVQILYLVLSLPMVEVALEQKMIQTQQLEMEQMVAPVAEVVVVEIHLVTVEQVIPQAPIHHKEVTAVMEELPLHLEAAVAAVHLLLEQTAVHQPEMVVMEPHHPFRVFLLLMLVVVAVDLLNPPLLELVVQGEEEMALGQVLVQMEPLTQVAEVVVEPQQQVVQTNSPEAQAVQAS